MCKVMWCLTVPAVIPSKQQLQLREKAHDLTKSKDLRTGAAEFWVVKCSQLSSFWTRNFLSQLWWCQSTQKERLHFSLHPRLQLALNVWKHTKYKHTYHSSIHHTLSALKDGHLSSLYVKACASLIYCSFNFMLKKDLSPLDSLTTVVVYTVSWIVCNAQSQHLRWSLD